MVRTKTAGIDTLPSVDSRAPLLDSHDFRQMPEEDRFDHLIQAVRDAAMGNRPEVDAGGRVDAVTAYGLDVEPRAQIIAEFTNLIAGARNGAFSAPGSDAETHTALRVMKDHEPGWLLVDFDPTSKTIRLFDLQDSVCREIDMSMARQVDLLDILSGLTPLKGLARLRALRVARDRRDIEKTFLQSERQGRIAADYVTSWVAGVTLRAEEDGDEDDRLAG